MSKEIVISERENIAATFENGKIVEFFMNEGEQLVGDIILGKVDSIIQSIDAAFVSIGKNRNGFIHITDLSLKNAKRKIGIKNHLKPKQNILVQIAKEATGSKGPRLTGMLTIPGKYMVLTPYERKVGISKKITDDFERDRLIYISKKICQSGYGIIVRTEAMGQSEEALKEDLDFLLKRWHEILKMSETAVAPAVLYRDQDLLYRVLRDAITPDVEKITVDTPDSRNRAVELLQSWSHSAFRFVNINKSPMPLSYQYNLFGELEKALQTKVPLPSGGYLIIEKTEALTVIDVNSGSTKGTSGLSETILQTNKESAVEIARQLRLRDIGGVIVIDFIDMLDQREQQIVWQLLAHAVQVDKAQPQLGYFSEFSLLEMTRHRQKKSLNELLTSKCPYCDGVGKIRNSVYRSDILSTESINKRVSNFEPTKANEANSKKLEELTGSVDYVENRNVTVPHQVMKYKDENDNTQISYPKYDRNNNKFDDLDQTPELEDNAVEITEPSNISYDVESDIPEFSYDTEELIESVVEFPQANPQEKENDAENFVVELTAEERQYIESIEEPYDSRGPNKNKKFVKNKKEFPRRNNFDRDRNNKGNQRFPQQGNSEYNQENNSYGNNPDNQQRTDSPAPIAAEVQAPHHQPRHNNHNRDRNRFHEEVKPEIIAEETNHNISDSGNKVEEVLAVHTPEVIEEPVTHVVPEVVSPVEEIQKEEPVAEEIAEEPVKKKPGRGRKPLKKPVKAEIVDSVAEAIAQEDNFQLPLPVETVSEEPSNADTDSAEESEAPGTEGLKPKKRGRIKSFSPKKRK